MSYAQRPWPTHPDGSPRPLGDMRPAERLAFLDREPSAALKLPPPRASQAPEPQLTAADKVVGDVIRLVFAHPRAPSSACYQVGMRAALLSHLAGTSVACHWPPGSTERDAFWAGVDEGNVLWHAHGAEMQVAVQWQRGHA